MSDISPIKAKLDAKVDLTESTNKITNTIVTPFQYLTKGVKKICVAWGGRMIAKSERHNMLEQAQNEKDAEDIKSGKKEYRNGILLNTETIQTPQDYYKQIDEHNAYCDAERLNAAMFEAAIELSKIPEEEISDEPLDKTYFNRWRAEAELIDDEDLRTLWAHLLVEETKKPNSISLRTLDIVKNLSKEEATLFQRVSKAIISGVLMTSKENNPLGGIYTEHIILQDARLLNSNDSVKTFASTICAPGLGDGVYIKHDASKLLLFFEKEKIQISCFIPTVAGAEIYNICKTPLSMDEIKKMAVEIAQQNSNARVTLFPLIENNQKVYWSPIWSNRPKNSSEELK